MKVQQFSVFWLFLLRILLQYLSIYPFLVLLIWHLTSGVKWNAVHNHVITKIYDHNLVYYLSCITKFFYSIFTNTHLTFDLCWTTLPFSRRRNEIIIFLIEIYDFRMGFICGITCFCLFLVILTCILPLVKNEKMCIRLQSPKSVTKFHDLIVCTFKVNAVLSFFLIFNNWPLTSGKNIRSCIALTLPFICITGFAKRSWVLSELLHYQVLWSDGLYNGVQTCYPSRTNYPFYCNKDNFMTLMLAFMLTGALILYSSRFMLKLS